MCLKNVEAKWVIVFEKMYPGSFRVNIPLGDKMTCLSLEGVKSYSLSSLSNICFTKVQVPPYATLVFVSLFITPFTPHVSALLIGHLQV
jgi:hypothetical protein